MATLDDLKSSLPSYAKDLKLNLGSLLDSPDLSPQQSWGCAVAVAIACRNAPLREAVLHDAAAHLSDEAMHAARGAAAIMGMNNIYYRSTHMLSEKDYSSMPVKLRMQIIGRPGIDKADFELFCLAVSAVNGCGACLDSHDKVVRDAGLSKAAVQQSLRIASVLHAIAVVLDAEA
ncbi:MAG: alkyl hydroperoxide reductase [Deltaproteobacteria bacterium]|nr:MAG: alkyl hydroperoxide reductase [Deltaproteobacteria bacterium]